MSADIVPFNPLDTKNLGATVAEALVVSRPRPLGELSPFGGAGIYAIYYTGAFPPYSSIAARNAGGSFKAPIYVGKAIPAGARKGTRTTAVGQPLFNRLSEHADSIRAAANLNISDFHCRFLVVDDIWIPLGESLLISRYAPLWNNVIDGFGNHDPGKGRYNGMCPRWDILHPGRAWAVKCKPRLETAEAIAREVEAMLSSLPVPPSDRFVTGDE